MHGRIFRAFPIGPFTIIPEGAPATTGIPVILGRKGAFGSGEHETTVACMEELAKVAGISGATVLDLGSGTLAFQRQGCMLRDSRIGAEYMPFIMEQAGWGGSCVRPFWIEVGHPRGAPLPKSEK